MKHAHAPNCECAGHQNSGSLMPCNSFMVVNIAANEAKVECVMNNFVRVQDYKDLLESMSGVFTEGMWYLAGIHSLSKHDCMHARMHALASRWSSHA